jgi:hypothetical protein
VAQDALVYVSQYSEHKDEETRQANAAAKCRFLATDIHRRGSRGGDALHRAIETLEDAALSPVWEMAFVAPMVDDMPAQEAAVYAAEEFAALPLVDQVRVRLRLEGPGAQIHLADRIGVSRTQLSEWLNGNRPMPERAMPALRKFATEGL